tara:strand:- start:17666 stop:18031 length:366 start_codon:yes stop_codon:yes gene_type:complete
MLLIEDFNLPYSGFSSIADSQCRVRKFEGQVNEPDVVAISAILGQSGTSITNRVEDICETLRNEQPTVEPIWVEHYPKGTGINNDVDTFAIVTFNEQGTPEWTPVTEIELMRLTGLLVGTL